MGSSRCKMICTKTGEYKHNSEAKGQFTAEFQPVYSNDPDSENKKFWEFTPSGKLELGCINDQGFKAGKEYYIDITPAE
jgi:hypothetical protein